RAHPAQQFVPNSSFPRQQTAAMMARFSTASALQPGEGEALTQPPVGPFPSRLRTGYSSRQRSEMPTSPGRSVAMEYLEILDSQGRHRRIALDQPRLLIGREHTCDVFLPHPSVSRRHAQVQQTEQGRWMLQDLNSLNHVYVDNRPVKQII